MVDAHGTRSVAPSVALVTGATGALGRVVAKVLLDGGAQVIGTYRSEDQVADARTWLEGTGAALERLTLERVDLTSSADVAALVDGAVARLGHLGRLDVLVNAAGGWAGGRPLWEADERELDRMLDVNLRSAHVAMRAVLPHMVTQGFGRIVNVASRAAVRPTAGAAAYAAAKAALVALTEAVALDLHEHAPGADVTVNCVLPSVIDTAANRTSMGSAQSARWATPEQVAQAIRWLASPGASATSGAAVPVYGRA